MGEHGQKYTSGGIYEDQVELDWQKDLGREPELTTVTKLPRRVFSFSYEQIRQAVRIVRPTQLALTFCDYLEDKPVFNKDEVGEMGPRVRNMIRAIREATDKAGHGVNVETVSYGPDLADTFEMAPGYGVKQNAFKE
jgi:adenylosuccinate synthase